MIAETIQTRLHSMIHHRKNARLNCIFGIDFGVKVTRNIIKQHLHHVTHAPAKLEVCNVRGGRGPIQKFVEKLSIFFMHYRIVTKTSHTSNKSNRFGCSYKSYSHNSNEHTREVPHIKFQTLILVFILIRFMNFLQITPEMFYKY